MTKAEPCGYNLPGTGSFSETLNLKQAPGAVMVDMTRKKNAEEKKKGDEGDVESVKEGVRRRSTMVIPTIQPKIPNNI